MFSSNKPSVLFAVLVALLIGVLASSCMWGDGDTNYSLDEGGTGGDDDDDDDDDDDSAPPLPEDVTVGPGDGEQDVPPSSTISISSENPLDPETLDFVMREGINEVTGWPQFSPDLTGFYFFPYRLLEENTIYTLNFTLEGTRYTTEFTTVVDAGDIPLVGNADAASGEFYAFEPVFDDAIIPEDLGVLITPILNLIDFLFAPVFTSSDAKEAGTVGFGGGAAVDFDGDEDLEQNHSAAGYHYTGEIVGKYFSMTGSFEIEVYDVPIEVDMIFVSGSIEDDGLGNLEIQSGQLAAATMDCDSIKLAFPDYATEIDEVCDEVTGIFIYLTAHADYNPIPDLAFDAPTIASDSIEVSFDPPLYGDVNYLNPLNAQFEVYSGTDMILNSLDYLDYVSFPDCCTQEGPDWWSFSSARFDIPAEEELEAGDYTLRTYMGLYGFESDFTIP